ncbi:hypothetical protein Plhal703r1_c01g0004471 [Plasmopara halstedii]
MRAQILKYTNWIIDCDYKKNLWESFNVVDGKLWWFLYLWPLRRENSPRYHELNPLEVAYRAAVGPLYAYRASLLIT